MFPQHHLKFMGQWTNVQLSKRCAHITSASELLLFIGVLVLLKGFEFGCCRSMWATTSKFKCVAALKFATIMHRTSFEILRSCIRFRNCHNGDDEDMNRLNFVDDFVKAINEHRAKFLSMPDLICDDE
eukprot:IDg761t1